MSVSWSSTGSVSHGTNSSTPSYPASLAAGDFIGCVIASAETSDASPSAPSGSGWALLYSVNGGPGTFGVDSGNRRTTVYWKSSVGGEAGTETVTIGGSTQTLSAQMFRLTKTLDTYLVSATGGSDTSSGTGYSVAGSGGDNAFVKNGGHILALSAWVPDTATPTGGAVAWTGTGTSTVTGRSASANTNNNDLRITIQSRDATGDSSGVPTYSLTLSAAGGGSSVVVAVSDVSDQTISPSSFGSDEAFGSHTVSNAAGDQTVSPSSISTGEAFGSATITPGGVTVSPSSVASGEAFGSATVTPGAVTISPSGIATAGTFGTAVITTGPVTISPSGLASGEAFGTATLTAGAVAVSPSGIASAESFGSAVVSLAGVLTIAPSGIASAETFGNPTVTPGAVTLAPAGIATAELFGTAVVTVSTPPTSTPNITVVTVDPPRHVATPVAPPLVAAADSARMTTLTDPPRHTSEAS